ncbi:MAG: DUF308 domain-containing protein [Bacillota bacterium]
MDPIERIKPLGLFLGVILMVIGVIFIAIPSQIVNFLATLIGVLLLVAGLVRVIAVSVNWKDYQNQVLLLLFGLAVMAVGIYMIVNTQVTVTLVGIIIGIFAILMAFDRFLSVSRRREGASIIPTIIFGLIHLAFGVGLIYASMAMFSIVVIIYGLYFLLAGLMVVLSLMLYKDF